MLKIPGSAALVRCFVVVPLVVAAACSGGGDSAGGQSEKPMEPGAGAGAAAGEGDAVAGAPSAGGKGSSPDPVGTGNVGSVGEEPVEEPDDEPGEKPEDEPDRGGTGGARGEPEDGGGSAGAPGVQPGPSEAFLRGQELVEKNECVTCHQADFSGFTVFPNITPDVATGIGAWTDEQIIAAIRDGRDVDGAAMCATMQRYAFSDEQVSDVVAFLRGLPPVKHRLTSACPGHGQ